MVVLLAICLYSAAQELGPYFPKHHQRYAGCEMMCEKTMFPTSSDLDSQRSRDVCLQKMCSAVAID